MTIGRELLPVSLEEAVLPLLLHSRVLVSLLMVLQLPGRFTQPPNPAAKRSLKYTLISLFFKHELHETHISRHDFFFCFFFFCHQTVMESVLPARNFPFHCALLMFLIPSKL